MHIQRIKIENVASIRSLRWSTPAARSAGWHVIIGDNGSGKSSLLRAVALALIGAREAPGLRQDWDTWLRQGAKVGRITVTVMPDRDFDSSGGERASEELSLELRESTNPGEPFGTVELKRTRTAGRATPRAWSTKGAGWFSSSYGPFRRFTGGDREYDRLLSSSPNLARHMTVFGEEFALTEALDWLRELNYQRLERPHESSFLDSLFKFVNQDGFLPHNSRMKTISSHGVDFVDGNGATVPVELLSDGYRSVLSMTFDLIRQLARAYGPEGLFSEDSTRIEVPGVVLIDEVDAHLHPTWQREIGLWFCRYFPNMQFLVTTHSPLVLQAAERGTIMRLPQPGTSERPKMLKGIERERVVFGNLLDVYGTGIFGEGLTRSEASKERMGRLAELNVKKVDDDLSAPEEKELVTLREAMPSSATIAYPEEQTAIALAVAADSTVLQLARSAAISGISKAAADALSTSARKSLADVQAAAVQLARSAGIAAVSEAATEAVSTSALQALAAANAAAVEMSRGAGISAVSEAAASSSARIALAAAQRAAKEATQRAAGKATPKDG